MIVGNGVLTLKEYLPLLVESLKISSRRRLSPIFPSKHSSVAGGGVGVARQN